MCLKLGGFFFLSPLNTWKRRFEPSIWVDLPVMWGSYGDISSAYKRIRIYNGNTILFFATHMICECATWHGLDSSSNGPGFPLILRRAQFSWVCKPTVKMLHTFKHIYIYTICIHVYMLSDYVYTYIYIYVFIYIYIIHIYICLIICVYIWLCMYIYIYINMIIILYVYI